MAHKKSGGASARQGSNTAGKRLGLKVFGGGTVKPGQIIIRQRGRTVVPGKNVKMGRDFTIFSKVHGIVEFVTHTRRQKKINVVEQS